MRAGMYRVMAIGAFVAAVQAIGMAQQTQGTPTPDMAAAMARAKQFTQPGPNHKVLERFIGSW